MPRDRDEIDIAVDRIAGWAKRGIRAASALVEDFPEVLHEWAGEAQRPRNGPAAITLPETVMRWLNRSGTTLLIEHITESSGGLYTATLRDIHDRHASISKSTIQEALDALGRKID